MRLKHSARFVSMAGFCLAALLVISCGVDSPESVSALDCEKVRDHMVELRMETVTADHDQHRAAIRSSLAPFISTCVESATLDQLRCSLAARDFRALAACNRGGA